MEEYEMVISELGRYRKLPKHFCAAVGRLHCYRFATTVAPGFICAMRPGVIALTARPRSGAARAAPKGRTNGLLEMRFSSGLPLPVRASRQHAEARPWIHCRRP